MADDSFATGFETDGFDRYGRFTMSSEDPGTVAGDVEGPSGAHTLYYDEPEPLGGGKHASPVTQMFGSLVACQLSVLNQCLQKSRVDAYDISAEATIDSAHRDDVPGEMPENTAKRIDHVSLQITLTVPEKHASRARRCLEVYDQGCIVGQSFRAGIDYSTETELSVT